MTTLTPSSLSAALRDDLLALADTKLVLGNWYAECVINGRSLPDFAAMLGMSSAQYGHARALYQFIASFGDDYATLERGRGREDIRSLELLDRAPGSWEDFLAAIWLAELSSWTFASRYLHHADRTLAGIVRKIGQEVYFHLKYVDGWVRVLQELPERRAAFVQSVNQRLPLALAWFGRDGEDAAYAEGDAALPGSALRERFVQELAPTLKLVGIDQVPASTADHRADWRSDARRHGAMPEGIYEVVRFKHQELAH
ncbi:MAG: phenylacetate-CoA oxygenase subunit PaaI [Burkholderiales bacterium]|nr:phenylacetate-CoA oxygenase subunit PaaI [Burkholderiales bacterium]ODU67438.1 MAG: hypothetical protein ABT05_03755 [Lautropia sp. SCN 66-9]